MDRRLFRTRSQIWLSTEIRGMPCPRAWGIKCLVGRGTIGSEFLFATQADISNRDEKVSASAVGEEPYVGVRTDTKQYPTTYRPRCCMSAGNTSPAGHCVCVYQSSELSTLVLILYHFPSFIAICACFNCPASSASITRPGYEGA